MNKEENQLDLAGLFPDFSSLGAYPATAEQLSALFVAVLIFVAGLFLIVSVVALFTAHWRTNWIRKLLSDETSKSVLMNRQRLRDKASKVRNSAGHLWVEFDETLVEAKVGDEAHLHNIHDASMFFNSSTLAREITDSRMLAAVPGFLTALGVIGTFVGLQLGLSELNIGNDAAVQEMKTGVAHVISGAKIAFMTSVWGVSLSVIFNFIEKLFESYARSRIHHLQMRIDELFPRFSAEVQLKTIAEDGKESREALQGLAERIGEKMQESLIEATAGIQQGLEASLEKIMAPAINKLVNETTDGSQKALEQLVEGFLGKFGEQGEAQREAMDAASKGVGEALSSITQDLGGFIQRLDQTQNAASEREQQLVEHISEQVDVLVETNSKHGQLLAVMTRQQIEKMTEKLDQTQVAQEARESQLGERFETVIASMSKSIDRQSTASEAVMKQGQALQKQVEASQKNMEVLSQSVNSAASELRSAADQLKEYGEGVQHISQQLSGVIHEAAEATVELANENQKSTTAVVKIHQQIATDIVALNDVVKNLESVVQAADSTFTHLEGHQQNYLAALQANVQELAEQGSQLLSKYAEQANAQTGEHLNLWAKHTTAYAEQMNNAARALSTVVDEIEDKLGR